MSSETIFLNRELYDYLCQVSLRESEIQQALRAETAQLEASNMQIAPEQGQFMTLLVQLLGAKRIIEVGVFTGYSSLAMAMGMPADGRLIACDVSETWTAIAQRYWQQAGQADKIDLCLAPAIDTLDSLLSAGQQSSFDLAFIDADKGNYRNYYERCLKLLRPGGLVIVDNVLWGGSIVDESNQSPDTCAIREFNAFIHQDRRVDISLVPIGDGLTLARKR